MIVTQIAAGDAHSLALSEDGLVFGWGFTSSGQLGTGDTAENLEMNSPKLQVKLPMLLTPLKPKKILNVNFTF